MQTSTSLMFDLETLSTSPNAVVMAAGWCFFNRDSILFSRKVILDVNQQDDREVGMDTLRFWAQQDQVLFLELLSGTAPLAGMWWDLKNDIERWGVDQWWANPASFDQIIAENLFDWGHHPRPWTHRDWMCFRTFMKERPNAKRIQSERPHDPMHDAIAQARTVMLVWQQELTQ